MAGCDRPNNTFSIFLLYSASQTTQHNLQEGSKVLLIACPTALRQTIRSIYRIENMEFSLDFQLKLGP